MNDLVRPAMYDAWHGIVPVSAIDAIAAPSAGLGRRPGLRKRRHLRAQPFAAAAGAERARGDPRRRRLWCGHEFDLQRPPAGGRGLGGQRDAGRSSATASRSKPYGNGRGYRHERSCTACCAAWPRRRLLARAAILFEALWPALWPAAAAIGLFLCAALLDLPPLLPVWLHLVLLAAVVAVVIVLLVRGLRSVRLPDDRAADRRLESRSGLIHRPLSVLTDRPAATDALGAAIWQAHAAARRRANRPSERRPAAARPRPPRPRARCATACC